MGFSVESYEIIWLYLFIVAVLTKPRKWILPTFQEKVKTKYVLFQKRDTNQMI